MKTRYAVVSYRGSTADTIRRYLPGNYVVTVDGEQQDIDDNGRVLVRWPSGNVRTYYDPEFVIVQGVDSAGWTMQDYVLPRLASGLHFGHEVSDDGTEV